MSTYGSTAGVAAYTRHMSFDAANNPTTADVEGWLVARSAQLTGWLAAAGYAVPVVQTEGKAILDRFANMGAAGDAELAQRIGGYSGTSGEDRREALFLAEFAKAEAWINGSTLEALGVVRVVDLALVDGAFSVAMRRTDGYRDLADS